MATFLQDRNWLDPAKCCMAGEDGRIQSGKMGRKFRLDNTFPFSKNGSKYDLDNLQSLCQSCHRKKTEAENPGLAEKRAWMEFLLESE